MGKNEASSWRLPSVTEFINGINTDSLNPCTYASIDAIFSLDNSTKSGGEDVYDKSLLPLPDGTNNIVFNLCNKNLDNSFNPTC